MRISSSMRPLDPNPHLPSLVHLAAPLPTPPPGSIRDRRRLWPPHLPPQPNPSSKTPATTRSPLQVSWETRCRLSFQSISLARSLLLSLSLSLSRPFWSIVTNQLSLPPVCPSVRPSVPPSLPLPLPPSNRSFILSLSLFAAHRQPTRSSFEDPGKWIFNFGHGLFAEHGLFLGLGTRCVFDTLSNLLLRAYDVGAHVVDV